MSVDGARLCSSRRLLIFLAAILGASGTAEAQSLPKSRGCLYATTVGDEATPVIPCERADPLHMANDPNVRKVIATLGLDRARIRFQGCRNGRFSAAPDASNPAASARYVITYPTEASQSYLAPITHELAHVLQMEMAGGLSALQLTASRRIELGADYLAGIVFARSLQDTTLNEFQHNLSLMGLYAEMEADAHGTWPQRTAAFRIGVHLEGDEASGDIRELSKDFQANRYGHLLKFGPTDAGSAPSCGPACEASADTEVKFDKLTQCDAIARLYATMTTTPKAGLASCRSPRTSLERQLVKRAGVGASQICFTTSAPETFLQGFSCAREKTPVGASLVCFRPAELTDVRVYKEQLKQKFGARSSEYMRAAAACRASNGDSAIAQATLFPVLLSLVSNFEFGFIAALGTTRPTGSSIVHGYATTDPNIPGDVGSALEFVYMLANMPKLPRNDQPQKTVGEWHVEIDDSKDFDDFFNREARKNRAPIKVDAISFKLRRHPHSGASQAVKVAFAEKIQHAIAASLEEESFEMLSEADWEAEADITPAEVLEQIVKQQPVGMRYLPVKPGPTLLMLFNEERPKCTDRGRGAMGAFLTTLLPVPEVASDYGSVDLFFLAVGACARGMSSNRTYMSGLIEDSTEQLLAILEAE